MSFVVFIGLKNTRTEINSKKIDAEILDGNQSVRFLMRMISNVIGQMSWD